MDSPTKYQHVDTYAEGWNAFHQGLAWSRCPYAHMALSPSLYQWMCGWDDASIGIPLKDNSK